MGDTAIGGAKRWKILASRLSLRDLGRVKERRLALKAREKMGHNPRRVSHE